MKCVICHSEDILEKNVMEEFKHGNDIIAVPLKTLCVNIVEAPSWRFPL